MASPVSLLINIDHIATVRNARGGTAPDIVDAARTCVRAGANGIVCHLREDRRHIRDKDVHRLRHEMRTRFDLEMAATPEIVRIALRTVPDLVALVPERRRELTTEGGLDIVRQKTRMKRVIERFHDAGIPVSLFVDPIRVQIEASAEAGADMVELHTGEYADAVAGRARLRQFYRLRAAAALGVSLGLKIHAGHGLHYTNTARIVRIPQVRELSIGYAIIVRALSVGLARAVREMVGVVRDASHSRH
ncbi:MAG: pyridoxine 5'-phosphate synthase [Ignavibacteria bacterium RIFCSPHIGHO2_02_FULL_56_12]|nr:MAG: pyridoxine 5'-phosphate synthase [Ignavibacteria bacterium RIFCSPHIGHO2_02_FULL_56_12]